jgi:hypothetical protein
LFDRSKQDREVSKAKKARALSDGGPVLSDGTLLSVSEVNSTASGTPSPVAKDDTPASWWLLSKVEREKRLAECHKAWAMF